MQLAKPRRLLTFCGLLTLALNTAEAVTHGQYGTAAVEAIGPILLICWADTGPWLLRQIHTRPATDSGAAALAEYVRQPQEAAPQPADVDAAPVEAEKSTGPAPDAQSDARPERGRRDVMRAATTRLEQELWTGALRLDAEHRAEHGRPITRDALREGLNIGTDKATELNRRLREHTARTARLAAGEEPVSAETARNRDAETASLEPIGAPR